MNKNEIYDDDFHFDDIDKFCDSKLQTLLSEQGNQDVDNIDENIETLDELFFKDPENIEILDDLFFKDPENIEILDDLFFKDSENIEILNIEFKNNREFNKDEIEVLEFDFTEKKQNKEIIEILDINDNKIKLQKDELEKNNIDLELNKKNSRIKDYTKKKIILFVLLIIMLLCLSFVIYKIICWKQDNNSIDKQMESIKENVIIEEIDNNENTIIVEVPSDSLIEDNTNNSNINQEPIIDKNNDYWKFIDMPLINVDFTELININADTIGWIQVNGTNINYPVVQTNDNEFYLNHSFDKKYNDAGWIFADYRNNLVDDKNLIIYGHSRLNSTMFGTLKNVVKANWYTNSNNHLIKLSTINTNTSWQVFSTYIIDEEDYYIQTDFNDNNEYLEFLNTLKNRSVYKYSANVNENDRIITLSTCYINNQRVVLHAKLIKYENRQ